MSSFGCLTIVRSCYCNGLLSYSDLCPSTGLPLTEFQNCTLNNQCTWANLSDWSTCTQGTQYRTRQCSCQDTSSGSSSNSGSGYNSGENSGSSSSNSGYNSGSSSSNSGSTSHSGSGYNSGSSSNSNNVDYGSYSKHCNGYTRIVQSCQSNTQHSQCISPESWRTATWPQSDQTKSRTFTQCSTLTWYQLITKSSYDEWETLAVEVIAARLNILSGATCEYQMEANIESANNLLNYCTWNDDQFQQAQSYYSVLTDFNNGQYYNSKRSVPNTTVITSATE